MSEASAEPSLLELCRGEARYRIKSCLRVLYEGGTPEGRRCRLHGVKVPAPWGEGAISKGLGDYLQGSWRYLLYPLGDASQHPWEVS